MKRIAILDFDGTLSKGFISMEFLDYLFKEKLHSVDIYNKQMAVLEKYKAGDVSYEDWCHEWGLLWAKGLNRNSVSGVKMMAEEFFKTFKRNIYSSSRELVDLLKQMDYRTIILATAANEVASIAGDYLSVDGVYATKVSILDGFYTGSIITNLHMPGGKKKFIEENLKDKYDWNKSIAFGDSISDAEMLEMVEIPVVLNPSEELRLIAEEKNWHIFDYRSVIDGVKALL